MSILDSDFDIDDDLMYRSVFLQYIANEAENFLVILLVDPDNVVNMPNLQGVFPKKATKLCDMSQCQTADYVPFVQQFALPLAQGKIDLLLLDNIDQIPDSELKDEYEQLLKYMAKRELYNPFQNLVGTEYEPVKRSENVDFSNVQLIMRCAEVPNYLQRDTYILINCQNYTQFVDEMPEDSQKQST